MVPDFGENGYLPAGIHPASLEEIAQRFGRQSELRRVQMESLRWLVDLARRAGVERIIVNGSFVTDVFEPNDVDCVLVIGTGISLNAALAKEFDEGLPFIDFEFADQEAFEYLVKTTFASDRNFVPKGMIEVIS